VGRIVDVVDEVKFGEAARFPDAIDWGGGGAGTFDSRHDEGKADGPLVDGRFIDRGGVKCLLL
jgi:hypothetical protein